MATTTSQRRDPCTTCGQPVTVVRMHMPGRPNQLGGDPPTYAYRHTARGWAGDRVDDQCTGADPPQHQPGRRADQLGLQPFTITQVRGVDLHAVRQQPLSDLVQRGASRDNLQHEVGAIKLANHERPTVD